MQISTKFKVVSICALDKTLIRMFSGKKNLSKKKLSVAIILSSYHLPVEGCSDDQKLQVDNTLVRGNCTLVFY